MLNTENENCRILNVENEKQTNKQTKSYNYGHYILRILVILLNFPFTTSETKRDY